VDLKRRTRDAALAFGGRHDAMGTDIVDGGDGGPRIPLRVKFTFSRGWRPVITGLKPEQERAATFWWTDRLLIIAGRRPGKTRTLVHRVAHPDRAADPA